MKPHLPIVLASLLSAAGAVQAETPAAFQVLEQGIHSGIQGRRFNTIRDKDEWRSFWQEHHKDTSPPPPSLPEVDFSKDMVIAAFAGRQGTGGYQLNLVGLKRRRGHIEAALSLTRPGPDCIVAQAPTQPYLIAKIAQSNKPVDFQLTSRTFSCVTGSPLQISFPQSLSSSQTHW